MKESVVQSKILNYLKSQGHYCIKTIMSNKSGVPDILACVNGKFYAFEVKKQGNLKGVSSLQQHNIDMINKSQGKAFAVDSVDTVKDILKSSII